MDPYLVYCVNIWGGTNVTTISPIVKAQKRAVRCILNVPRLTHTAPLFTKHSILPFSHIYKLQVLLFVYKFKMSSLPRIFHNFFTKTQDIHNYRTRQIDNYYLPRCKFDTTKSTVKYKGCLLWNGLDYQTKSLTVTIKCFKNHILKTLASK